MRKSFIKLVTFICRINMPFLQPKMSDENVEKILSILKPSMVILTRREGEFTNWFQPEFFTHGVLVITKDHCIEAKTTGTVITNLSYLLSRCDNCVVLEPRFLVNEDTLVTHALEYVNKNYDFAFEDSEEKLYCFEAVAHLLEKCSGVEIPKSKTPLGHKWLPNSFLNSNLFVKVGEA